MQTPALHRSPATACAALLVLLALSAAARADGEVKMYAAVPSEAELAADLFPPAPESYERRVVAKGAEVALVAPPPAPAPAAKPAEPELAAAPEPRRVGFRIQFANDSSELNEESLEFVDRLGALLAKPELAGQKLLVEGHTDAAGPEEYNYMLSKRRARAVAAALMDRFKIEPGRLVLAARGEDAPLPRLAPEDPANRRVEFAAIQ